MGEVQGQGYIAQALGVADMLAVSYFHALRYRPDDPEWEGRDRFLLSIGHYAIALYAALIEAGIIPEDELESYGSDDSRLPMSGHGGLHARHGDHRRLARARPGARCRLGLGLKRKNSRRFVYNLFSDGELDEGSIWEARAVGEPLEARQPDRHRRRQQPAGGRPIHEGAELRAAGAKFEAFGWHVQRVNGNDIDALVPAFDEARALTEPKPRIIICDTRMAKGVPFLEAREKNHFLRVEPHEWRFALKILDAGRSRMTTLEVHTPGLAQASRAKVARVRQTSRALTTSAMIASLAAAGQRTKPAPFGHALAALAETRPEIVGLTADLGKYTDLHIFAQAHPDRFYQMGMAEQLLISAAAGMAREGSCRSPPPTRCSRPGGPTTSSAWRSPKRTSTSRSSAPCRG